MTYFPMFVELKDRRILIVGGGPVAAGKLRKLLPFGGRITVVAPEICGEIEKTSGVTLCRRSFRLRDLYPRPALVISATGDGEVSRRVYRACKRRHIPVNAADDARCCSFFFPAMATQGSFCAGFSTGGASPSAAAYFKGLTQAMLPDNLDEMLDFLEEQRRGLKKSVPEQSRRAEILRAMLAGCLSKGRSLTEREAAYYRNASEGTAGTVALVGAGCGKADLITLRGAGLLAQCQAVVYDDLIDPALLELAPESAQRVYMGKRSGAHAAPQAEINETLIRLARSGLRVVRLKGGDPYLFGRGGEEMLALKAAGIPCQEIPGIPSAIGIPAEAGIPVTHRELSRGVHIVTGHTADTADGLPEDFDAMARLDGTLVFLMGLGQLPKIVRRLMAAGKDGTTPAAVLSGGNSANPARVRAPLDQLEQAVQDAGVAAPAIILVGGVAELDL